MGEAACTRCDKQLDEQELLRFGESLICGDCKPLFFQGLREGTVGAVTSPPPTWFRMLASLLIFSVPISLINFFLLAFITNIWGGGSPALLALTLIGIALGLGIALYEWSRWRLHLPLHPSGTRLPQAFGLIAGGSLLSAMVPAVLFRMERPGFLESLASVLLLVFMLTNTVIPATIWAGIRTLAEKQSRRRNAIPLP